MKNRDHLHKQAVRSKNENDILAYRQARNKVTCEIRNNKRRYVSNKINNSKNKNQL